MHSRHSAPKFTSGSSALFESAHTPALVIYVFVCVLVPYSYRTPTLWERRTHERQPCARESPFCWLSCLNSKNAAAWLTLFLSRAPLFIIHVCVPHSNWQRGERKAKIQITLLWGRTFSTSATPAPFRSKNLSLIKLIKGTKQHFYKVHLTLCI